MRFSDMMDRTAETVGELHLGDVLIHWTKSLNWAKPCGMQDLTVMKKNGFTSHLQQPDPEVSLANGVLSLASTWPNFNSAELEMNLS